MIKDTKSNEELKTKNSWSQNGAATKTKKRVDQGKRDAIKIRHLTTALKSLLKIQQNQENDGEMSKINKNKQERKEYQSDKSHESRKEKSKIVQVLSVDSSCSSNASEK